jgi:catechol 2,3-dioxygenase-like lactoylglutathione lyase family enzyme
VEEESQMKRIIAVLCTVLSGSAVLAEKPAPAESARVAGTGAFFGVSVPDLEASARWYEEKLGLKVVMRAPKANGSAATVLEGDGLIVELIQRDGARPWNAVSTETNRTLVHGLFKTGVIVADFDRTLAMLRSPRGRVRVRSLPQEAGSTGECCHPGQRGQPDPVLGPVGHGVPRKPSTTFTNFSGSSKYGRWPLLSNTSHREFGIALWIFHAVLGATLMS